MAVKRKVKPPAKKINKLPPIKNTPVFRQFWRLVDAGVRDAFANHPEYIANGVNEKTVRQSINKRVAGQFLNYIRENKAS